MRAFRTRAVGVTCLVFAGTRGQARATTARSAVNAGFDVKFFDVSVSRWPEFDDLATPERSGRCWTPSFAASWQPG